MAKGSKHEAADSALGYYHQAMYALIVLLDAGDDDVVSIESRDDIEVVGPAPKLLQLKHSLGKPPALTEKNDGLWNTFAIWIPQLGTGDFHFVFVTCAEIDASSDLLQLTFANSDRRLALVELEAEASRVIQAVADFDAKSSSTAANATRPARGGSPYVDRVDACRAFISLTPKHRSDFLKRITILHRTFNVTDIGAQVERRLMTFTRELRPLLAQRLVEWWDPRVARSLSGRASRTIAKAELLTRVQHLVIELADDNLPDDFGLETPPSPDGGLGSVMEQQIQLVGGGPERVTRPATARWRARSQRARWMSERVELGTELTRFDDGLIECWRDRHGPLRHDCLHEDEAERKARGLELLDWSHNQASREVPQPRPKWTGAFLTQGSYQQLAEERRVGWHPEYESLLSPRPSAAPSTSATAPSGGGKRQAAKSSKGGAAPRRK